MVDAHGAFSVEHLNYNLHIMTESLFISGNIC